MTWILGVVSPVAAIVAAIVAGVFAARVKSRENEAQRIRDLENRISEKKFEVYQPMINEVLANMFDKEKAARIGQNSKETKTFADHLARFAIWITIFGSDEAVVAFRNFMQSTYNDPPAQILMRLYGDFVVAARKDMGYPDTTVTAMEFLGMRINDLHASPELSQAMSEPFDHLCARYEWTPPWLEAVPRRPRRLDRWIPWESSRD